MANLNLNLGETLVILAGRQHVINTERVDYLSLEESVTTTYQQGSVAFGTVPSETPAIGDGVDHPRIPPKQI